MSIDRGMDKEYVVQMYNGIVLSHIKRTKIMSFAATQMDLEIIILTEVRERQILYGIIYTWKLKTWYKRTYLQNRNRLTDIENKLMVIKGESGGGIS